MSAVADPWVVIPTYNEAANIGALVDAVRASTPPGTTVLIVDDSSPDGTGGLADRIAAESAGIEVIHRPEKQGLGPAYVEGFRHALGAGAQVIGQMDADFSHDPADLPRLFAVLEHADLVLGSRYVGGGGVADWGPVRRLISRGGSAYARAVLGVGDPRSDRRLQGLSPRGARGDRTRDDPLARLLVPGRDDLPGAARAGFRVVEVPIVFRDRRVGESKMSGAIVAEAALRVPAMRVTRRRS